MGSADRKRKMGAGGLGDLDSDDETMGTYQGSMSTVKGVSGGAEDAEKDRIARENHCETERRRRVKMAAYFHELCDMLPTCSTLARKPDKLTILRMAVDHLKNLQGIGPQGRDAGYKPSFLTDQELKHLIMEAADGFLFVVQCDTGRILYVSDSVTPVLNHTQAELFGTSLFDHVHSDDVEKLREQLSTTEPQNSGRILDLKTGTVKKEGQQSSMRLCMGSRRAFICRVRTGNAAMDPITGAPVTRLHHHNTLGPARDGGNYAVVHCSGYIKNWPPPQGMEVPEGEEPLASHCCLVAIGRLQTSSVPNTSDLIGPQSNTEFITRQTLEGKFTFVDQRITTLLGFQPSELLGKNVTEFYHPDDQANMKETIDQVLKLKGQVLSVMYRFRAKPPNPEWAWVRTSAFSFHNPYTDDVEYIVCTTSLANNDKGVASGIQGVVEGAPVASFVSRPDYVASGANSGVENVGYTASYPGSIIQQPTGRYPANYNPSCTQQSGNSSPWHQQQWSTTAPTSCPPTSASPIVTSGQSVNGNHAVTSVSDAAAAVAASAPQGQPEVGQGQQQVPQEEFSDMLQMLNHQNQLQDITGMFHSFNGGDQSSL